MTTFLFIFGHIAIDGIIGWILLNLRPFNRDYRAEDILLSILLGMYADTLSIAAMMFAGIPFASACRATLLMAVIFIIIALHRRKIPIPSVNIRKPEWYELALLFTIGEKVLFILWQLIRTHMYFDDALHHWSGRARSLYAGINWSVDSESPYFLAKHLNGSSHYPFLTVIWRAATAFFNGGWDDVISRSDGLIFFVITVAITWSAVMRFSQNRRLAAFAAFIVSALPLQAWHAASGYSDIAVETFIAASLVFLLRRELVLSGIMIGGAAWCKNDGLALYLPAFIVGTVLLQQCRIRQRIENIGRFLFGFATLMPWLVFKYIYSLGVTPNNEKLSWHPDAFKLFWNYVIWGPTSSIFWLCMFVCIIWLSIIMLKDPMGRALIGIFLTSLTGIAVVFGCTGAYMFLENQTTIHRSMMQISGISVIIIAYGISLKMNKMTEIKNNIS